MNSVPRWALTFAAGLLAVHAAGVDAPLPPLPEPVTSFGAAIAGGAVYVYGGHLGERHLYHRDTASGAFHRLALAGGAAWERLPGGPPLQGIALVEHGGRLYRTGGMSARNAVGQPRDLHSSAEAARFDPASGTWETLAPLPAGRSTHDAAMVGSRLYVGGGWQLAGGTAAARWHDTVLVADLAMPAPAWQSLPQPFRRRGLALASLDSRVFFLGGMNAEEEVTGEMDILDTATGAWSKGPELPGDKTRAFAAAACVAGGRLWVSLGSGAMLRLARDGQAWEEVGRLLEPRVSHRLVPVGDARLLALGGDARAGHVRSLEFFTPTEPERRSAGF